MSLLLLSIKVSRSPERHGSPYEGIVGNPCSCSAMELQEQSIILRVDKYHCGAILVNI